MNKKTNNSISLGIIISIIPGFLIFYGFNYLSFYYKEFDIDLSSIFTFNEITLTFLHLNELILSVSQIFLIAFIFLYFFTSKKLKIIDPEFRELHYRILIKNGYRKKFKGKKIRLISVYYLIFNIPVLSLITWFILTLFEKPRAEPAVLLNLFMIISAGVFIFHAFKILSKNGFPKIQTKTVAIIIFLLIFYSFSKDLGRYSAYYTKKGKANEIISFRYDTQNYYTDSNIVLVANTNKYVILRNIKDSSNLFFEREHITHLKTHQKNKH